MQLKAEIQFADPTDYPVTISLTGTLRGFELLPAALAKAEIPYHEIDNLMKALREITHGLRRQVRHLPELQDPTT